jgi:salicylate hydroxylase
MHSTHACANAHNTQVGAGIQIPPNSGRLLHRWGVYEHLRKRVVAPEGINLRRWQNGHVIGYTDLGDAFVSDFEVPYYVVHRAHFHEALHMRAKELGAVVELNKRVVKYDELKGVVILADGSVVQGDLVIAADGKIA